MWTAIGALRTSITRCLRPSDVKPPALDSRSGVVRGVANQIEGGLRDRFPTIIGQYAECEWRAVYVDDSLRQVFPFTGWWRAVCRKEVEAMNVRTGQIMHRNCHFDGFGQGVPGGNRHD